MQIATPTGIKACVDVVSGKYRQQRRLMIMILMLTITNPEGFGVSEN